MLIRNSPIPLNHSCYYSLRNVWYRIRSPKVKCEGLTRLITFIVIAAHCVLCKVRNQCHRWIDITHNMLQCNNSLIPDPSQQCHRNALFGFSIVQFHRNLIGRNSGHIPLQIWPQLTPLSKVIVCTKLIAAQ